jgi:acetyl-CoA C-acetyltransferase
MTADDLPIAVGVGQYSQRPEDLAQAPDPLAMMATAARAAAEDAGAPALLQQIDTAIVVNLLSWTYPDPAGSLSALLGAHPRRPIYTALGGNTPQLQVNATAAGIAAGEIGVALIAGAEAMYSLRRAQKTGVKLPWPEKAGSPEMVGDTRWGNAAPEMSHRAQMPTQIYPLFENAIRAARGRSVAQQREFLGRFCARFAAVARDNPYAWFRDGKSAEEIATPSAQNRMIGFPYPKYMNAIMEVDQSAAVLLTNVATARKLGIPREKWVYVWGGGDATDHWFVGERVNFHSSPAMRAAGREAMTQAGVTIDEIRHFDLYSCFPCAPQIGAAMLGIAEDDPRALTVTGGLPYAGGPGNNYSTHAIAAMVERLRRDRGALGLVTGVGWYLTKHSAGIYGSEPPPKPRPRREPAEYQSEIDARLHPAVEEKPAGEATIETYTVLHDREGAPETGLVVGRLANGARFWANTPADAALLEAMEREEFIGRRGRVRHDDTTTLNVFEIAGA